MFLRVLLLKIEKRVGGWWAGVKFFFNYLISSAQAQKLWKFRGGDSYRLAVTAYIPPAAICSLPTADFRDFSFLSIWNAVIECKCFVLCTRHRKRIQRKPISCGIFVFFSFCVCTRNKRSTSCCLKERGREGENE